MNATNTNRWIGIGLLGLPLYGMLTFWSTLDSQPDFSKHPEAWSRFVTTDHYLVSHLFGSDLGLIFAIFGVFALGAYLASGPAWRLGCAVPEHKGTAIRNYGRDGKPVMPTAIKSRRPISRSFFGRPICPIGKERV